MNDSTQVPFVDNGAALLSMRNSDFDAYSAYGEVVDNSIQANAKNIKIYFDYESSDKYQPINAIVFGDDGDGMPKDIIHQCLQLGYSSRFNDRKGIGRFGVGATLAAINQCQKIEIYSKESGGEWFYTYIDIEEITAKPPIIDGIPEPTQKNPPEQYKKLISDDKGTLVIWSKYDKQDGNASEIMKRFEVWVGRTYRKFIWDGLDIYINNAFVHAIDPLYVKTEKTKFPNDPKAHEYEPMEITWSIDQRDLFGQRQEENSIIKITMSILPEEFRRKKGDGGRKEAKERYIDDNEGVSILRNNREVFYGHIPYWPGRKFDEMDRWWGCEISFDAVLDSAFMVRNIKRGAVPIKILKEVINDKISATRDTVIDEVRKAREKRHIADPTLGSAQSEHIEAERIGKKTLLPKSKIDADKDPEIEIPRYVENSEFLKDISARERAAWEAKFKSQPFSIQNESWQGPDFFEAKHLGGKSVLSYNIGHEFFSEIYEIIDKIETSNKNRPEAEDLKIMIDLLIMSFAKAEASFPKDIEVNLENFLDQLKSAWGNYLKSYTKMKKSESSKN